MASIGVRWVLGGAAATALLCACSAEGTPSGSGGPSVAPPVVGDVGGTATPRSTAATSPPAAAPAGEPAAPSPADVGAVRTMTQADLADFVPKTYCMMPKLSSCSIYGSKYPRLESVEGFCVKLGGEVTTYCPTENLVARCMTEGNVISHYYAVGEKPHTKESAEAKCAERKWAVIR